MAFPWHLFCGIFVISFLSRVLPIFLGINLTPMLEDLLYIYKILKPNAHCCYYWIHLMIPNILGECINSTCSFNRKVGKHSHPIEPNFSLPYLFFSTITITHRAVAVQISIFTYFSAKVKPTQTFQLHW